MSGYPNLRSTSLHSPICACIARGSAISVPKDSTVTQLKSALAMSARSLPLISIAILSLCVTWFFWCAEGYNIPGGSAMFFTWGDLIGTHATLAPDLAQRDLGFPLLIWLSGYPLTRSFVGISLIYASFSFLMPVLVYWTVRPFGALIAWFAGLATIASCGPWVFAKFLYPDEAGIFFTALSLTLLARYLVGVKVVYLYGFTAAAIFLSITRPAMNAVFPCLMLVAILFGSGARQRWLPLLGCIAAFAIGLVAYHEYRARIFDVAHLGYTPSYTGEQVFYNAYVNSAARGVVLGPELGPAMTKVYADLTLALAPSPRESVLLRRDMIPVEPEQFAHDNLLLPTSADLIYRIWHEPNFEYSMLLDAVTDDATLLRASLEIAWALPGYVARYTLRNAGYFLVLPGFAHTRYNTQGMVYTGLNFYPAILDLTEIDRFPAPASDEARGPRQYPEAMEWIAAAWAAQYERFILVTTFLMAAGWIAVVSAPFLYSRAFLGAFTAASGLLLYNAIIVGAFAEPDFRYEAMVWVLRCTVGSLALVALKPKRRIMV